MLWKLKDCGAKYVKISSSLRNWKGNLGSLYIYSLSILAAFIFCRCLGGPWRWEDFQVLLAQTDMLYSVNFANIHAANEFWGWNVTSVLNVVGPHCECHCCNVARFDCEINVKVIVMFLILMGFLLAILRGIGMYRLWKPWSWGEGCVFLNTGKKNKNNKKGSEVMGFAIYSDLNNSSSSDLWICSMKSSITGCILL